MKKLTTPLILALVIVAQAFSEEGQLFVRTAPAQAQIFVNKKEVVKFRINEVRRPTKDQSGQKEELVDTGEKSPAIVRLDIRKEPYEVTVRKEGYEEKTVLIAVDRTGIIKPDVIHLRKLKHKLDILTPEPGWSVFVDGNAMVDVDGKPAVTPCTVAMEDGAKQVAIAKEGFYDQSYPIPERVAEMSQIRLKRQVQKGKSKLLATNNTETYKQPETDQEWIKMKGTAFVVKASYNSIAPLQTNLFIPAGNKVFIAVHPDDKWGGGGSKKGLLCSYKGYGIQNWMKMFAKLGTNTCSVENPLLSDGGKLEIYAEDDDPKGNIGQIRIKVISIR